MRRFGGFWIGGAWLLVVAPLGLFLTALLPAAGARSEAAHAVAQSAQAAHVRATRLVFAATVVQRVPTAVAIIGQGADRALVRVDARTLGPLRVSRRTRLPRGAVFALWPNSSRVAIATENDFYSADTASGRVLQRSRNEGFDASEGIYWVGSSADPLIIAVGASKFGWEYTAVPSLWATEDTDLAPEVALHGSLVLSGEG